MTASIPDAQARREALDPERSFCVQAPAGSGKTELLTQRVLRLLAGCDRPEEILAITFTRKAAAEMRARLLDSLASAAGIDEDGAASLAPHARLTWELARAALARDRERHWRLLENSARLRVTTIDSFNSGITAQLPVISGFGAQPEIREDMEPLYQEAVAETLALLDGRDEQIAGHLANLLSHLDDNLQTVQKLLCGLLASRDQWLGHIMEIKDEPEAARQVLQAALRELVEDAIAEARHLMAPYGARLMPLLAYAAANLAEGGESRLEESGFGPWLPDAGAEELERWRTLCDFLLTKSDGQPRRKVDKRDGFPAESALKGKEDKARAAEHKAAFMDLCAALAEDREAIAALTLLRHLPPSAYSDAQWGVLESLTRVLPLLVAQLSLVLRRQGQADYVQVSSAALEALGTEDAPTDLALRLDYRIRHILVDEFQDTSYLQVRLLEKLCYGWQPGDGRTLFIVGDGMQSCYGFRNANVGLFLKARDQGIGAVKLEPLQLTVNFRSQEAVVQWVNRVFTGAFPAHDDISRGAVRYSTSDALHRDWPGAGVETWLLACDKTLADAATAGARREAEEVAALVERLQREAPGSSIAVLVRYRSHLRTLIPYLREAGIAWNASDIDPLSSYPEIRDLLTLARALLNLADKTAWLALLRAPWAGLAMADIHRLARHAQHEGCSLWGALRDFEAVAGLSADALARLRRLLPALSRARGQRARLPLRDWLEAAWIDLGGAAAVERAGVLPHIARFFELLEEAELRGDLTDVHDFESELGGIYASAAPDGGAALQIMTIHKAKGLEFDFVILPGLGRQANSDDNPLLRWREHLNRAGDSRLLISVPAQKGQDQDGVYQYLKYEAGLRGAMENTRLLYIGVTRAAKKAWLLGNIGCDGDKLNKPVNNSLLATIWPSLETLQEEIPRRIIQVEEAQLEPEEALPALRTRRLPAAWLNPLQEPRGTEEAAEPRAPDPAHRNALQRKIGELIHHALQAAAEGRLDPLRPEETPGVEAWWRAQLKPLTADPEAALDTLRTHVRRCAEDERGAWLLDPGHAESACELALSDFGGAAAREYVIDRCFVDAEGTRWIIDYKSASPGEGQPLKTFLAEQEMLYRAQLQDYARLFRSMEERPLRTALFFTALAHFLEIRV